VAAEAVGGWEDGRGEALGASVAVLVGGTGALAFDSAEKPLARMDRIR